MSAFIKMLNELRQDGKNIYIEFSGGVYPGTISALSDDYVIVKINYQGNEVRVHRHYSNISIVGT